MENATATAFKEIQKQNTHESSPIPLRVNPILEAETTTHKSRYSPQDWHLVECQETGFVFLTNPPDYSFFMKDYAWEHTSLQAREKRHKAEPIRAQFSEWVKKYRGHLNRGEKVIQETIQILSRLNKKKTGEKKKFKVIDIGCGEGLHGAGIAYQALYQYGMQVEPIGIEISNYLAELSHKRYEKYGGYVIHQPAIDGLKEVEDHSADVIILMSFLEHEIQPAALMNLCRQKLKSNGSIILKVPNYKCWNRVLRGDKWCGFRFPDHVNYFEPRTLKLLVKRCGLRVSRMNMMDRLVTSDNMWAILTH